MKRIETIASMLFGAVFLLLSVLVSVETVLRKFFSMSLQGADELGGYALAIGGTLAFSLALLGRTHIRIDLFHELLPIKLQSFLNWLSSVLMAVFSAVLCWTTFKVIGETQSYGSTAATPWATPLIYPQGVWFVSIFTFALVSTGFALRASWLYFKGDVDTLNIEFHPKGVSEEVKEELEDFEHRSHAQEEAQAQTTHPDAESVVTKNAHTGAVK
ncbi:TRAP transporter small permease [Marinobacterium aestuarii]|uniref:TRAP transporter small permease n=1 Tax=Marinobacterium aestuarii TaxID=1821621 RepID=UPI000A05BBE6|nr:TRAP transporter small permease [Marinobacterium aestuarii]